MPEPIDLSGKREEKRPPEGEAAPKPPPRRKASSQTKASTKSDGKRRTPNDRKLGESVEGLYQVIGASLTGIGLRVNDAGLANAGVATIERAEVISEAWLDLADSNPKVKSALLKLTEVSSVGVLVGLHLTIALPILIDRKIVPDSMAAHMATANGNGSNPTN